ncbi:MAG: hypothetical protein PHO74_07380, partial [Weeksellaceae bacterium]|nr:hypothetical protein [Weeksellaceae bacterium]
QLSALWQGAVNFFIQSSVNFRMFSVICSDYTCLNLIFLLEKKELTQGMFFIKEFPRTESDKVR